MPAQGSASGSGSRGLRHDLVSTFKAAFRLDVTSEVLSEIRDRLVTLRAGLQVSGDPEERRTFVDSTLGSIRQLVDMADFGPVEWPDVPPREVEPGEVLSPLEASLAATHETQISIPDLDNASSTAEDPTAAGERDAEDQTAFVDRAISQIDAARRQVSDVRSQMGERAANAIGGHMRASSPDRPRYHDSELAEASARAMRERFASDPAAAVRAMGQLDPEAVLTLVA
jgi:hypothetical protein